MNINVYLLGQVIEEDVFDIHDELLAANEAGDSRHIP